MKNSIRIVLIVTATLSAIFILQSWANEKHQEPTTSAKGRWFTKRQFELVKTVHAKNCARRHGPIWHYSFSMLLKTSNEGGAPVKTCLSSAIV